MKKKILIIDDDPSVVLVMKSRLEANGFQVVIASEGGEGLEKACSEKPDLILLDIRMPNVDGWTFMNNMKNTKLSKEIPVIMTSAHGKMKELFASEGVVDFITKPFTADDLLEKIRKHLPQRSAGGNL